MIRKYILKITTLIAIMILPATSVAVQLPNDKQPSTAGIVEVFDANNKIIGSVPGIAIDGGGYIITEYEPFRNAARADYVMGKNRIAVSRVGGASDLYDVIKLLPEKNVGHSFAVSSTAPKAGDKVKIIGSKAKKGTAIETQIMEVSSSTSINYLSLAQAYDAANVGLPVVNAKGELIGVVQRNGGKDAKTYAIDAKYCSDMSISAMSWGAASLTNIKIPAELPKEEKSAWNYIYMMLETKQDSLRSITAINDFLQKYPSSSDGYQLKASFCSSYRDYAGSDKFMQQAISLATKDTANLYFSYSKLIYNAALYDGPKATTNGWTLDKALDEAEKAYRLSHNPLFKIQIGNCLYGLKRYKEAVDNFTAANQTKIADAQSFYLEARAREKADTTDEKIIVALDSAIGRFSKPYTVKAAPYLMERGDWYVKFGKYREATLDYIEYEHIVGFNNLNENFYYMRYKTALQGNMYQTAEEDINRALAIRPNDYVYLAEKAALSLRVGMMDEAIVWAEKAVKIDSSNPDAYRLLGIAYGEKKNKEKCISYLKKAVSLGDKYATELIKNYNSK